MPAGKKETGEHIIVGGASGFGSYARGDTGAARESVSLPSVSGSPQAVWLGAVTVALVVTCFAVGQTPHFHSGVTNVYVQASVTQEGRTVEGLTKDDLIVSDEGEPQTVVAFGTQVRDLDLVLLLDVSGSMVRDIRELATNARLAAELIEPQDRVAVACFSTEAYLEQTFTSDRNAIIGAIRRVARRGSIDFVDPTEINASILDALRLLLVLPGSNRTRAILVVTDNEGLPVPNEPVIRESLMADTVLHAIVIHRSHRFSRRSGRPRDDPAARGYTNQNVFHIAKATGGDAIVSTTSAQVKVALTEMLRRIRSRYSMWYRGPQAKGGQFRRISVELSDAARRRYPDAVIKAREGYYAR